VLSLVRFGLADPDAVELFAGVELANLPSVRVLEKAGMLRISETSSEATYAVRR